MEVIYGLIPGMIILGLVMVGVFFWAARSGQYEDMDGPAHRILLDEDIPEPEPGPRGEADKETPKPEAEGVDAGNFRDRD